MGSFRNKLRFYLIDCKTPIGKFIDVFIIFLNLLIITTFVIETYPISEAARAVIWKIEVITVIIFIVEYIARLYAAEKLKVQFYNTYQMIDLIAIIPTLLIIILPVFGLSLNLRFLNLIRIVRVLRVFRFLRFMQDPDFFFGRVTFFLLQVARLALTILIIFFISSGFFYFVEHSVNPNVSNFGDAFYFTVVTITTVGFGDIIPLTEWGHWVTVLMIISGIIFIPYHVSQISRAWRKTQHINVTCKKCGLKYHDRDASHCKSCGSVIYQEYENT